MHKNTMSLLFLSLLVMGTALTVSSNSWLGVWAGLEINLMAFIPMMSSKNPVVNETSIKYFMIQAMASIMIMFSLLSMQSNLMMMKESMIMIIFSSLLLKLGAAPFHFWFIEVMSMSSWMNCMILMTWQKFAPMAVMSYCLKNIIMLLMVIIFFLLNLGGIGGMNHLSIRELLALLPSSSFGSINFFILSKSYFMGILLIGMSIHTGTLNFNIQYTKGLPFNYLFIGLNGIKLGKYLLMFSFFSLGGLPPFMGFLPKGLFIRLMINSGLPVMASIMVGLNMIPLYYYMKMLFSASIIMNTENKWSTKIKIFIKNKYSTKFYSYQLSIINITYPYIRK
uniref:NADH-ubiquinone oxidoreductase chain 2 n=1 Tax=Erianthus versicolor TaxID=470935 RepID=K9LIX3_9ORTH|nr:NADH dehydrogenase subunit 2 [Erianthus versicolor]